MTDARYAELKQTLENRRLELQRTLDVKLRDVRMNHNDDGAPVGALDAAEASDSDLQQDIAIALAEMTAQVLERIDQALMRLASGGLALAWPATRKSRSRASRRSPSRCDAGRAKSCTSSARDDHGHS
jgi:hypothetical protein